MIASVPCRDVWIMELHDGAELLQPSGQRNRRGLTQIRDIGLVGHAQQQDRRSVDRFGLRVEDVLGTSSDVVWHARVDLLSELDEPKRVAELDLNAMAEVVGVDRDAVTANARTWVEGWKPNGFVAARPMTSQRSMSSSWQNRAISLTNAMLTWR